MQTIHKFTLEITDEQFIPMPSGSMPLTAQFQGNDLVVWSLIETDEPTIERRFTIFGTGNPMQGQGRYLATAQDPRRGLVWHVFWG